MKIEVSIKAPLKTMCVETHVHDAFYEQAKKMLNKTLAEIEQMNTEYKKDYNL